MRHSIRCWAWVALLSVAAPALADPDFVRVDDDLDGAPRALQLAIASYSPAEGERGLTVDLIGAVHIGDAAYYQALNERFDTYDVLLYELVAPTGTRPDPDGGHGGLLSGAQRGMRSMLDLTFQLDEIDYGKPNFVHADLSPKEVRQAMAERDESLYTYFWKLFFASVDEYARDPLGLKNAEMLTAMLQDGQDNAFKVMVAYEMTDFEKMQDILGDDADSTIVGARNQRAIEVLRDRLDQGSTRIGIFYGVAHMPDFEQRLINELQFERTGTEWVDAWDLQSKPAQ